MTFVQCSWVVGIVLFLLLELATPSALVSIWFMIGSAAGMIVSLFCPLVWVQMLAFLLVSTVSLAVTRPLVRKKLQTRFVPTNADQVVGMHARVTQAIAPDEPGRVQVNGLSWAASAQQALPVGSWCTVRAINGVTLQVEACEKQE